MSQVSRVVLLYACLWVFSVAASAQQPASSQPDTSTSPRAFPPLTTLSTDELFKPALLSDGRLIAVALPMIEGVQQAVAIYSQDNGHTWSEPAKLFSLPRDEGSFGYYDFLVDRAGEMHFFFLLDPSTGANWRRTHTQAPVPEAELDIAYVRSTHHATEWQAPRRIWEGRGGDLLSVIQLRSGRLLLPISYRTHRNWGNRGGGFDAYTYTGQFDSSALYSDDNGDTWKQSPSVLRTPTPDIETIEGAVEPVVLQLKDGRVWMLIRSQMGRFYESFSTDEGQTWSAAVPTPLISSDSPPGLVRLPDERIVMILNRCLRFPYAYGGRHVLHAAVSGDEGRTWRSYREVVRDPLRGQPPPSGGDFGPAYPYPAVTKDGKVLFSLACETGTRSGQPANPPGFVPTQKRSLILLDPAWLAETSQRTDFSQGLDDWSVFGVKGVERIAHPTRPGAHALSVHKPESTWPAAAVWNFPMAARGRLRLSLMLKPGFGGAVIGLTDHYSVPYDSEDTFHNVYNFAIGAEGKLANGGNLEPDRWHQVDLNWDVVAGNAHIEVNGRHVADLRGKRESDGISYLRLRSTASDTDPAGFVVESVEAKFQSQESESLNVTSQPKMHAAQLPTVAPDPSYVEVPDDPALPRVLLIGDSISMQYTIPVRHLLRGVANVHRIPMNGSTTAVGIKYLSTWLGDKKWDVIHFNWGLHDLTVMPDGSLQVPLDAYEKNLRGLVRQLKQTGAALIWATTTPVPDAPVAHLHRRSSDAPAYNAAAHEIMNENGIAIDDLYSFALPRLKEIQKPANVHYTDPGAEVLAQSVAASIRAALQKRGGH